ncbi:hypothetical protein A5673_03265 [Mycobacterium sp. E3198]|nr:hypothetical protein A5673_03265 [Mycobacterium sp. E3198]
MSYLAVAPEFLSSAATDLSAIGSAVTAAHTAAAAPTAGVVAAADDEVSAAVASLFSSHGREFQAVSAQAAAFHAQFVQALSAAGGGYGAAEAANVAPLRTLEEAAAGIQSFSPWRTLTGRPLFGDGTNGAPGTGQAGGPGGWLFGNGGNGGSGAAGQNGGPGGSAFLFGNGGAGGAGGIGTSGDHGDDSGNTSLLLAQLRDVPDERRGAAFVSACALVSPSGEVVVRGEWPGTIAREARGEGGFGYDPVFLPRGEDRTAAQLSPAEKDAVSHRGRALALLVPALRELVAPRA